MRQKHNRPQFISLLHTLSLVKPPDPSFPLLSNYKHKSKWSPHYHVYILMTYLYMTYILQSLVYRIHVIYLYIITNKIQFYIKKRHKNTNVTLIQRQTGYHTSFSIYFTNSACLDCPSGCVFTSLRFSSLALYSSGFALIL